MHNKIIKIKHVTGTYTIAVKEGKLNEMQTQLDKCLNDEQGAIVVKGENGDQFVYPSDFLKNSFISIVDREEVKVS
ncbi:glyceraldehyde-3-phosphate dehydrogenase [Chryseobacterium carnipullorum]|uniref:glyceraldehyde-3-phosphate dehydrogenase n=1 Tax=Chryseobacterium carnipullorum TaxID=1124835 RepID=UPI000E993F59|nr:glyceraldehyde-3-phosphate dehydrogenase [Chryseobacterium carnipullorum]HBV17761.1 glyceraldehyde-3-phosphate dehydrogenase [Chryseobacterium carnipullorum]